MSGTQIYLHTVTTLPGVAIPQTTHFRAQKIPANGGITLISAAHPPHQYNPSFPSPAPSPMVSPRHKQIFEHRMGLRRASPTVAIPPVHIFMPGDASDEAPERAKPQRGPGAQKAQKAMGYRIDRNEPKVHPTVAHGTVDVHASSNDQVHVSDVDQTGMSATFSSLFQWIAVIFAYIFGGSRRQEPPITRDVESAGH